MLGYDQPAAPRQYGEDPVPLSRTRGVASLERLVQMREGRLLQARMGLAEAASRDAQREGQFEAWKQLMQRHRGFTEEFIADVREFMGQGWRPHPMPPGPSVVEILGIGPRSEAELQYEEMMELFDE